jgi:hypothetical protein
VNLAAYFTIPATEMLAQNPSWPILAGTPYFPFGTYTAYGWLDPYISDCGGPPVDAGIWYYALPQVDDAGSAEPSQDISQLCNPNIKAPALPFSGWAL